MTAEPSGPLTVEQVGHLVRNFLSSPATFPMEVVTERLNALLAPILAARDIADRALADGYRQIGTAGSVVLLARSP